MSRKPKYTYEQKVQACEDYISGKFSAKEIAQKLHMTKTGPKRIREWAHQYETNGAAVFLPQKHNKTYSKEFKESVVREYLDGSGSMEDLTYKYNISNQGTLWQWIIKYTEGEEIKDYDPHPEVYMASPKKTTFEERIEIVEYCLSHDRNYKKTATEYNCSYNQVRNWVLKYEEGGKSALIDKRGRRKKEDELSEVELLKRENKRLTKKLEEQKLENELLKKVQEIERRRYIQGSGKKQNT